MKIVCAWCKQEGREALLGEREPIDDPIETHSICARHSSKLLEELPSPSFPGVRLLFVVRPAEAPLYEHLTRAFAGLSDVRVIMDRRQGERRKVDSTVGADRRQTNRRVRRAEFSSLGYLTVRFGREHHPELVSKRPADDDRSC